MKMFFKSIALFALICAVSFSAGCKARQKMKVVKIKKITRENVHGVIATDDDHIWLTGNYGTIYHSADGGQTWVQQPSGIKESILIDGVFLDNQVGWLVGPNGTVVHTTDGGAAWARQDTGTDRHLFGISFPDKAHGWAVGEWHTIIHTADGGKTWQQQDQERDKLLNNVFFTDNQEGWIVGERGKILHTTDGGGTWATQLPKAFERESFEDQLMDPPPSLYGICFTDRNNGWACGIDGTIVKTADGGTTWTALPPVTKATLYSVFVKDGKGWAVGDKGAYLTSDDGGTTWALQDDVVKSKQAFRDVYFSSLQKGWIVGVSGTVVHTADGGATWDFRSGLSYAMEFFQMPRALEFRGMPDFGPLARE